MAIIKADAAKDIGVINRYALREMTPDEVFCFSAVLCNNQPDRDDERFADAALYRMAELFVGKPGVVGHEWSGEMSSARIYRAGVKSKGTLLELQADIYIPRIPALGGLISKIDSGIIKEVSVACEMGKRHCSICGSPFGWDQCEKGHIKGEVYEGEKCLKILDDPKDAFEFSFVSVPAQPGAGIVKRYAGKAESALRYLIQAEVELHADMPEIKALMQKIKSGARREDIKSANEEFMRDFLKG